MPRNKYTKELLEVIVKDCTSWAQVCRKLDITPATGSQTHLTRRAKALGVNTSHFKGQGWNKGMSFDPKPLMDYLVENSNIKSHTLRLRLIKEGLKKAECENCHRSKWEGLDIPLELDHINSDHFDNRLENLKILCPNCHAIKTNPQMYEPKVVLTKVCKIKLKGDPMWRTKPRPHKRKVERPSKEILIKLITENPFVQIAKIYNVSDNAIRKWCKSYSINYRACGVTG